MARIFLSYARDDVEAARSLAGCMSEAGHEVWWDRHLHGGSRFASEIDKALKDAEAVVVIWSAQSIDSAWVQDEAGEGRDSGRLVPVSLASVKPPLGFRQFQTIDLGAWDGTGKPDAIQELLEAVGRTCGTEARPSGGDKESKAAAPRKRASVCVLPFINMSGDPEQEYFSDGITEDIITDLSKVSALSVVARNTAFTFKGSSVDVKEVAATLGVDHVLEGSVRKAGRRLRITTQLIDVASGYHLFSERYDREMEDVFAVQDEIARAIAETLQVRLTAMSDPAGVPPPTKDLVAYDSFLKGRYDWNLRRMRSAVAHFRAAVDRDPDYAAAHLALADAYAVWGFYGGIPCWEAFGRARTATENAARIEPDSAGVHLSLGIIEHYYGWDTAREESELRLAAEKEPRSADPYTWLALCWAVSGRFEEALEAALKATEREPHSANALAVHGWAYAGSRRFAEAVPILEKAVALEPDAAFPRWSLGLVQRYAGKLPEAIATLETAVISTHREHTFQLGLLSGALAQAGRTDEARAILGELLEKSSRSYVPPYDLAISYVGLGEKARALDALERAYDERNGLLWYRIHKPMLDPLRDEPRFKLIADRLARLAPMRAGGGW